jgi:hypothetical protein
MLSEMGTPAFSVSFLVSRCLSGAGSYDLDDLALE